jgi:hypothetical protein
MLSTSGEKKTKNLEELKKMKAELDDLHFEMKFPEGCDDHDHVHHPSDQQGVDKVEVGGPRFEGATNDTAHFEEITKMQALKQRLQVALQDVGLDEVLSYSS